MSRWAYFDWSAIVKLAHYEPESLALIEYLEEPIQVSTSAVAAVEVMRMLRRESEDGEAVAESLRGFFVVTLDKNVREAAAALRPVTLRSLDAIHVASALTMPSKESLDFVTYDDRLAQAARANGLRVVQPGR